MQITPASVPFTGLMQAAQHISHLFRVEKRNESRMLQN
jgi:hypothetical protein